MVFEPRLDAYVLITWLKWKLLSIKWFLVLRLTLQYFIPNISDVSHDFIIISWTLFVFAEILGNSYLCIVVHFCFK